MPVLLAPLLGLVVGMVLGGLGAGGSVLAIPVLINVAGLTFGQAATASLVVVGSASAAGAVQHWRAGDVEVRTGLMFGGAGATGAVGGTLIGQRLDQGLLETAFALLIVVVAVVMLRDQDLPQRDAEAPTCHCVKVAALGVGVGLLTGLFGVGGGFVIVPVLVLVLGHAMESAIGTSLVVITINAVVALGARLPRLADLPWGIVGAFTVAALVGTMLGGRLTDRVDGEKLTRGFAYGLFALALWTGWRGVTALIA